MFRKLADIWLNRHVRYTTVINDARQMTEQERVVFDAAFEKMDAAFEAMDQAFKEISKPKKGPKRP